MVLVEAVEETHAGLLLLWWLLGRSTSKRRRVLVLLTTHAHAREQSTGTLGLRRRIGRLHEAECVLLLRLLLLLLRLLGVHLIVVHESESILLLLLGLTAADIHASEEVWLLLLLRLLLVHEAEARV